MSNDVILEDNREDYYNCSVLYCIWQLCTMIHIHTWSDFTVDCWFRFTRWQILWTDSNNLLSNVHITVAWSWCSETNRSVLWHFTVGWTSWFCQQRGAKDLHIVQLMLLPPRHLLPR